MKPEKTKACLGIWMDHTVAHLIEFTTHPIQTKTLESKSANSSNHKDVGQNENLTHNKEQHQQAEFYKSLVNIIRNYDDVVLFGPTDAKIELFNILDADNRFNKIKIQVRPADKMTTPQQNAFIKNYFLEQIKD